MVSYSVVVKLVDTYLGGSGESCASSSLDGKQQNQKQIVLRVTRSRASVRTAFFGDFDSCHFKPTSRS